MEPMELRSRFLSRAGCHTCHKVLLMQQQRIRSSQGEEDDGEEEGRRRQIIEETKTDLTGQAEIPEELLGRAGATASVIDWRVVVENAVRGSVHSSS
ncbi:hypothetical protein ATANTOWER_019125 [Ataeniobius toweri]|uniref:Uncharacterized protein n=1 Tax=Ataeniobius toweri TaxID=208326 RepID=A0ABU7AG77_9TELE|nr:hypothetical protein [Ataeniobius toweri]